MQKLERVGEVVWVGMDDPVCEIVGKFCRFSLSYANGPYGCCFRTVWVYDSADGALWKKDAEGKSIEQCGSDANHSFDSWARLNIRGGKFGSPNYNAAIVEVTTAFDSRWVCDSYYPYRERQVFSNGRIGIRLLEICEANQTPAGAILDLICGH